jgi:hypothetical protein
MRQAVDQQWNAGLRKQGRGFRQRTIAIDCTMRTWLFPVTFDLFSAALVAGTSDSSSFLHLRHRRVLGRYRGCITAARNGCWGCRQRRGHDALLPARTVDDHVGILIESSWGRMCRGQKWYKRISGGVELLLWRRSFVHVLVIHCGGGFGAFGES